MTGHPATGSTGPLCLLLACSIEVVFGAQDVQFGQLWAPKVARDPQNGHLGHPKGPFEHSLGPRHHQHEALEVPLRSLLAPKMLKLELFGGPLGTKIVILEPIGSTLSQISIILTILIYLMASPVPPAPFISGIDLFQN